MNKEPTIRELWYEYQHLKRYTKRYYPRYQAWGNKQLQRILAKLDIA